MKKTISTLDLLFMHKHAFLALISARRISSHNIICAFSIYFLSFLYAKYLFAVLGNAIHHAKTPVMDALCQGDGYTTLDASGLSVGLPAGLMGNSEVGHLNIGAGRVVYQDIVRINMTSENKEFHKNEFFEKACNAAKNGNGRLHFLGLVCYV